MQTVLTIAFLLLAAYGLYITVTGQDPDQILAKEIECLAEIQRNARPVVYLRSFDTETMKLSDFPHAFGGQTVPGSSLNCKDVGDYVSNILRVVGPAVALSRPGGDGFLRYWSPARALRVQVDNDHWQQTILNWLEEAALVVIQVGVSPGLGWEFRRVVQMVPPQKVLLVLPPYQAHYDAIRDWINQFLPKPVPSELPPTRLLAFREGWEPVVLPRKEGGGYAIWYTLETVFEQNGFKMPSWRQAWGFGKRSQ